LDVAASAIAIQIDALPAAEADDFTPSAAVHKYTAVELSAGAVTGDCYAANDAKGS